MSTTEHGINFVNQSPKLIKLFDKLTTKMTPDGITTKYQNNSKCTDVICAAKEIFGPKVGPRLLYLLGKYGMNASPIPFGETAVPWNHEELEPVIAAFENLPPGLLPILDSKKLARYKWGSTLPNYAELEKKEPSQCVAANSGMEFFDCHFRKEKWLQEQHAFHEVSHYIGIEFSLHDWESWLKLSKWEETTQPNGIIGFNTNWKAGLPKCFVSKYAQANPKEDFAESMVAYRYNPQILKANCPAKYDFLKDLVFDGIEYTDEKLCREKQIPKGWSQDLKWYLKSLSYHFFD